MSKIERLYHLHNILSQRRTPISRQQLMEDLDCSQATLYRLIAHLRDHLGAPVEQAEDNRGFFYNSHPGERQFELPGVWLTSDELRALMSARDVLASVQPGLMENELAQLQQRIESLLDQQGLSVTTQSQRIRIIHQASRLVGGEEFTPALNALVERKQLHMKYHARGSDQVTERTVSPQRLTSYRHNWYLDAWCHLREGLRSFALEKVADASILETPAQEVAEDDLKAHFTSAYGIFSGPATARAKLVFSPRIARWVADELWHSQQNGQWLDDGSYQLTLPYGHDEELIMDILRFGADVQVIEPPALRAAVARRAAAMVAMYQDSN